ncbi:unnamed protein product [Pleuronectes platessa]|uniref:Uncharacterized protein n=1 Tax=Pleuronectes platessa TaxID=8262 RepID=A0A9N7TZT1_PLEPL|nr:unnamed protein product [Pleuronectes platessa]
MSFECLGRRHSICGVGGLGRCHSQSCFGGSRRCHTCSCQGIDEADGPRMQRTEYRVSGGRHHGRSGTGKNGSGTKHGGSSGGLQTVTVPASGNPTDATPVLASGVPADATPVPVSGVAAAATPVPAPRPGIRSTPLHIPVQLHKLLSSPEPPCFALTVCLSLRTLPLTGLRAARSSPCAPSWIPSSGSPSTLPQAAVKC